MSACARQALGLGQALARARCQRTLGLRRPADHVRVGRNARLHCRVASAAPRGRVSAAARHAGGRLAGGLVGLAAAPALGWRAPFGLVKWMTVSSLKMFTSSMPGMVFTPSRFSVFCRRLSSVEVVLCTAFFLLHAAARAARQRRAGAGRAAARRAAGERRRQHGPADGALAARADSARHLLQLLHVHGCDPLQQRRVRAAQRPPGAACVRARPPTSLAALTLSEIGGVIARAAPRAHASRAQAHLLAPLASALCVSRAARRPVDA